MNTQDVPLPTRRWRSLIAVLCKRGTSDMSLAIILNRESASCKKTGNRIILFQKQAGSTYEVGILAREHNLFWYPIKMFAKSLLVFKY